MSHPPGAHGTRRSRPIEPEEPDRDLPDLPHLSDLSHPPHLPHLTHLSDLSHLTNRPHLTNPGTCRTRAPIAPVYPPYRGTCRTRSIYFCVVLVSCVVYQAGHRVADIPVSEIRANLAHPDYFVWVALKDPEPDELAAVQAEFGLHELAVEDAQKGNQRAES